MSFTYAMTTYSVSLPARLCGTVALPASKSISARALVISALAGAPEPEGLSDCDDTRVLRHALAERPDVVDIHAAGTAMRFSTAYFAATAGTHTVTGTDRMQRRPIGVLVDALRRLGAGIDYAGAEGFPPLRVTGHRLHGGTLCIPAHVSSQYVSALLMVAPLMTGGLTLCLEGEIVSTPYIDMTLSLMRAYGAQAAWDDARTLCVEAGGYRSDVRFSVEPDWSAASYWYELVALSSDPGARIVLPGLRPESVQGDSAVSGRFAALGVGTAFTPEGAVLAKVAPTGALETDFTACPDLAQTFVVTCAMLGRPFRFTGLQSLRIKETDRLAALQTECAKLGLRLSADDRSIRTVGECPVAGAHPVIATYEDHRMAMAFAPCAYRFPGLRIADPDVVSKSYPTFWNDLRAIGADVREVNDRQ